jgi:hypothetical protein
MLIYKLVKVIYKIQLNINIYLFVNIVLHKLKIKSIKIDHVSCCSGASKKLHIELGNRG